MNNVRVGVLLVLATLFSTVSFSSITFAQDTNVSLAETSEVAKPTTEKPTDETRTKNIEEDVFKKQAEIEQKIAEKQAAVLHKLEGNRAQKCQRHETRINEILTNRVDAAQRHFDTFKSIQTRLETFVANKHLDVVNANALKTIMDDRQASALAAIETTRAVHFSCADTDATAPGKIVMDQVAAEKQALKQYRTAIKDYAVAVKSSAKATDPKESAQ